MDDKQRNPPIKEEVRTVGNTIFTIKSVESSQARQSLKALLKKLIESHLKT